MQGRTRHAFTLLEVLMSILILFTMGLALLKFDSWIKEEIARYKKKSLLLLTSTPNLYESRKNALKKDTLYDTMKFPRLRDDEIFWLKNMSSKVVAGESRKRTIFQSGELDLTYKFYPIILKRGDVKVGFVRVAP